MSKKIKINRPYIYKGYLVKNFNDLKSIKNLNNISECEDILKKYNERELIHKSECHYYVEKNILDFINNNLNNLDVANNIFIIVKIYDQDLINISSYINNLYYISDDKINIL